MKHIHEPPSALIFMLCSRCVIGGAEKRYARVFEMLVEQTPVPPKLVISRSLLTLLQEAGILLNGETHLIVLDPPFSRDQGRLPLAGLLNMAWYFYTCWTLIRKLQPAVVHPLLAGTIFTLPAMIFRRKSGYVVSAYTSFNPPYESLIDRRLFGVSWQGQLRKYALHRCDLIDTLSLAIQDRLIASGINQAKIRVAPGSFTDFSLCHPHWPKKKWVVFVGRFIGSKNPLLLAQAIPAVLQKIPNVRFYFLGRGYLQAELEQLISALNLQDTATIAFSSRPTQILNQSSLFVSLQANNNYPSQSLLEAMACGNAIVATDVGETWRLVDETNGLRVPQQPDAVAEAIVQLLQDPHLAEKQQASRRRVLTEHTPERFFEYITQVYYEAASGTDQR